MSCFIKSMSQALKDKLAARREARGQAPLTQNTNKVKFSQIGFLEKNMQLVDSLQMIFGPKNSYDEFFF